MVTSPDPFASQLIQAHRQWCTLDAREDAGPVSAEAAYRIQSDVWQALSGADRPTAWKVGAAARDAMPMAAPVFRHGLGTSPARLPGGRFNRPGIEAEIAFRLGQDLPAHGVPYTREDIQAAIVSAHVAMEVVDSRLTDPERAGPWWRLADSLLNGGLILGAPIPEWRQIDFSERRVRIHVDGVLLAETLARPPLDDLWHCLPWLVEHLGGMRAGDVVITGAWNGMHRVTPPTTARIEFVGLGQAEVRFE